MYILEDLGLSPEGFRRVRSRLDGEVGALEVDLLKPLASGEDVERYAFRALRKVLLFPYVGGRLVQEDAIRTRLPRTWAYLSRHEQLLRQRERGRMDREAWYGYVYPKNLTLQDQPKLGVAATVQRLEVACDDLGRVHFHNVRVNGITLGEEGLPLRYVQALLNSRLLDFVFRRIARPHANGYFAANRQFLAPLPIRIGDQEAGAKLAELAEDLSNEHGAVVSEREAFRSWLAGELGAQRTLPGLFDRYERHDLDALLAALRKQRRHLAGDPSTRSFGDLFARELQASRERLSDQLLEIDRLEREADLAVYEIYELSAGERALVDSEYEGATAGAG